MTDSVCVAVPAHDLPVGQSTELISDRDAFAIPSIGAMEMDLQNFELDRRDFVDTIGEVEGCSYLLHWWDGYFEAIFLSWLQRRACRWMDSL